MVNYYRLCTIVPLLYHPSGISGAGKRYLSEKGVELDRGNRILLCSSTRLLNVHLKRYLLYFFPYLLNSTKKLTPN